MPSASEIPASLLTRAEATRYEETSRHADVMAFVATNVPIDRLDPAARDFLKRAAVGATGAAAAGRSSRRAATRRAAASHSCGR